MNKDFNLPLCLTWQGGYYFRTQLGFAVTFMFANELHFNGCR